MHFADAFIQSDLQYIQVIHFFYQYVCSLGIEPTTFALLTQCSTTEPQDYGLEINLTYKLPEIGMCILLNRHLPRCFPL